MGASSSAAELFPEVYDHLRRVAHGYFRGGRGPVTLQPTAIVHDAYLKLSSGPDAARWRDRDHFCAVATRAMRQVLIDYCRRRVAAKRGGDGERITLSGLGTPGEGAIVDLLALNETLERLEALHPRMAQIVELRIFGGLTGDEIAGQLGVSRVTIETDWRRARAWLGQEMGTGWQFQ